MRKNKKKRNKINKKAKKQSKKISLEAFIGRCINLNQIKEIDAPLVRVLFSKLGLKQEEYLDIYIESLKQFK